MFRTWTINMDLKWEDQRQRRPEVRGTNRSAPILSGGGHFCRPTTIALWMTLLFLGKIIFILVTLESSLLVRVEGSVVG